MGLYGDGSGMEGSLPIVAEQVLNEVDHAVRAHLSDRNTLVMPSLLFLAWGCKPAAWTFVLGSSRPNGPATFEPKLGDVTIGPSTTATDHGGLRLAELLGALSLATDLAH